MTTRIVVGIVALACGSVCGMMATLANFEVADRVNDKLPKEEQFGWIGWYYSKTQRLHREYKRLYPGGRLVSKVRVLSALMFACLFICAWGVGLFGR
jgi:hypothetical protein